MIAADERLFEPAALGAGPARVADAAAEIMVAVATAGRRAPLSRGAASDRLSQARRAEDQREHGERGGQSRARREAHRADLAALAAAP